MARWDKFYSICFILVNTGCVPGHEAEVKLISTQLCMRMSKYMNQYVNFFLKYLRGGRPHVRGPTQYIPHLASTRNRNGSKNPKGASTLCRAAKCNTLQLCCAAKVARRMPLIWLCPHSKRIFCKGYKTVESIGHAARPHFVAFWGAANYGRTFV